MSDVYFVWIVFLFMLNFGWKRFKFDWTRRLFDLVTIFPQFWNVTIISSPSKIEVNLIIPVYFLILLFDSLFENYLSKPINVTLLIQSSLRFLNHLFFLNFFFLITLIVCIALKELSSLSITITWTNVLKYMFFLLFR